MNIRRYLKEKQAKKYVQAYMGFILLNYVICLLPILASYYFTIQTTLLASLLAYCFTLFAVTVYSFMYFRKEEVGGIIASNLSIIIAWVFMFVYITTFLLYNLLSDVNIVLNRSIGATALVAFAPAFVIPLALSIPVIRLQVAADKPQQLMSTIKRSEDEGQKVRDEIRREGL